MGRFEKQPENPRVRGELSRAAENALWAVVEDLENLQQNVLRVLQEDVKRLQSEKNRLSDDIQSLLEEKEHLQQVRQITEQQVLIRQLAEVLAKHISSQLQSSLATLANQTIEGKSYDQAALKSAQVSSNVVVGEINEKVEHMFDSLDDTVTVTFNSLQQEMKNYQSNLSQQLSRMYSQQQQGETILAEFVNRLHGELEKTIEETSRKPATAGTPTVLQFTEPEKNSSFETSPPPFGEVVKNSPEPISPIPNKFLEKETKSEPTIVRENAANPISVPSKDLFQKETKSEPTIVKENAANPASVPSKDLFQKETKSEPTIVKENAANPTSVPSKDLFQKETKSEPTIVKENAANPASVPSKDLFQKETKSEPTIVKENAANPTSVPSKDLFQKETKSEPTAAVVPPPKDNATEPISIFNKDLPESETTSEAPIASVLHPRAIQPSQKRNAAEPISLLRRNGSQSKAKSSPSITLEPPPGSKPPQPRSPNSSGLSPIQKIGFLLIVLSAVVSSLYNIAIKVIFHEGSQIFGVLEVERLLPPTLGNILLILTLRFMVVVPLMVLLSPILHPRLWQDLESLANSVRGNPTSANAATKQILLFSIVSGCFLFLSQVLIYIAIAQVTTGMAIALFFVYPMVSGLLSWFLFRDRPTIFRIGAIAAICCGELLVLGGSSTIGTNNTSMGSSTAILSGVAFAAYIILTRVCASKLHPVTFTLINFATMLLLSFICLMLPFWNLVVDPSKMLELVLSAFILGVLTLAGYLLNNVGISKLGGSRAALIGGTIPVLTVIFAGLIIQENLDFVQILGVLLVTFGAAAFSFETMRNQVKSSNSTN
ncbi:EamA family transporter [Nostoc sp.]|uniref:EamA family transporter n=1 Tax=Nostoc sp. TaxID=1180 RepID=UPI002FF7C195